MFKKNATLVLYLEVVIRPLVIVANLKNSLISNNTVTIVLCGTLNAFMFFVRSVFFNSIRYRDTLRSSPRRYSKV